MTASDLAAMEARIAELGQDPVLAELRGLKRQRRGLVAGLASGAARLAATQGRDEAIRAAYQVADGRYGTLLALARRFNLSVRQVQRILGRGGSRE